VPNRSGLSNLLKKEKSLALLQKMREAQKVRKALEIPSENEKGKGT